MMITPPLSWKPLTSLQFLKNVSLPPTRTRNPMSSSLPPLLRRRNNPLPPQPPPTLIRRDARRCFHRAPSRFLVAPCRHRGELLPSNPGGMMSRLSGVYQRRMSLNFSSTFKRRVKIKITRFVGSSSSSASKTGVLRARCQSSSSISCVLMSSGNLPLISFTKKFSTKVIFIRSIWSAITGLAAW